MAGFFRSLKRNNRREWFQPRKHLFEQHVKTPMLELINALNGELAKFAPEYVTEPKSAIKPPSTHASTGIWEPPRRSTSTSLGVKM